MTPENQKKYIKQNYRLLPQRQIARDIGRSKCFVRAELKRQELVVPDDIKKIFATQTRFKKGSISHNKGRPIAEWMSLESIEKTKATRFKKGHLPSNTRHDMAMSIRLDKNGYKYYWIRVSLNNWEMYNRWFWKQLHGDIPYGYNIQFKDGDTLNIDPDNFYMINRSKQVVLNGKGGKDIPYELQESVLLITQLKMKIDEKQNIRSK